MSNIWLKEPEEKDDTWAITGEHTLDMLYKPGRINPIGIYPAASYAENLKYRIERAIHKKRRQLKNVDHPVILAIQGSFTGTDYGDFDQVLFGTTYEQMDLARQVVKRGFDANGLFISGNPDPTYQGVLAIPHVGVVTKAQLIEKWYQKVFEMLFVFSFLFGLFNAVKQPLKRVFEKYKRATFNRLF